MTKYRVIWPNAIHVNLKKYEPGDEFEETPSPEIKVLLFHKYIEKV